MHTTARTIISSSIALGLALFIILSAAIAGIGSTATITGISLFVAYGMIEIMLVSYADPSDVLGRMRDARPAPDAAGKIVAFPDKSVERKAA